MPLYLCSTPDRNLAVEDRQRIARIITNVHCEATGAPPVFVHVVFLGPEQADLSHALTPEMAATATCQLYGSIRSGRSDDIKQRLIAGMCGGVATALGLDRSDVTMSTRDVDAKWVMEGGEVLPEPGEEADWLARHGSDARA